MFLNRGHHIDHLRYAVAAACWMMLTSASAQDTETLEEIEVIGVTPTHGVGLPRDKIPANVQSSTSEDIERSQSLDLTDYLNRNMGSISINSAQNNPLQPDVQFRGFTASPLLGLPQGLAVYVDGVRINEPFGDTVNWDMFPDSMIASINLIAGANPVFGLNTLGGALSVQSKNGFSYPGHDDETYGGSFGRVVTSAESGANNGTLGYYVNVRYFDEDGWRDDSPSDAINFFSTLSWRHANDSLDLHISHGNSTLVGNGVQAVSQMDIDRASIFTSPDQTKNDMTMVNLDGAHWFTDKIQTSGNLYYRATDTTSFNGDSSDFDENGGFLVDDAGNQVLDQFGNSIPDEFDAVNHHSERDQQAFGGSLQTTLLHPLFGRENQFIAGISYDRGLVDFSSSTEVSHLLPDRSTDSSGVFVPDDAVGVDTSTRTGSAYVTDTFSITDAVALTASGRYNNTHIDLSDSIGNAPDIDGEHNYSRFNPAAGLTWQVQPGINLFGGYSESARAPTPVELSCADPAAPCFLPNAFLSDPPLKQVVAKSFEGGVRGSLFGNTNYNLGVFSTTNIDDIIFQSGGATGSQGFFANVGDTRRQGVEVGLNGLWHKKLRWFLNYTYLDATFRDSFTENSPNHPDADVDGNIQVSAGDQVPGLPKHNLKLGADYAITERLSVGADLVANSGQYLRGDEANLLDQTDGYAIVNLRTQYIINKHISAFARIENLFDTDYETFGLLGEPGEVFPGITDPRMLGPGAPIGGWVGVKISL